ncbi:MAG: 4a-hydroxytetrahydrobiopterin dehydratase [Micromonosporaceae bacterium]
MAALSRNFLHDALSQLAGWSGDDYEIRRTLEIDDSEHADLTERAKVYADALRLRPEIRRVDGLTQIRIQQPHDGLTVNEVALAARIEDVYRTVTRPRTVN